MGLNNTKEEEQNFYWTQETNDAIDSYVDDHNLQESDLKYLYEKDIFPPIDRMIRIIIHRHNLYETGYSLDDLINQTHSKVYTTLRHSRDNPDKYYDSDHSASFHYFGRVIRNYLINLQRGNQTRNEELLHLDSNTMDQMYSNEVNEIDADYMMQKYLEYMEEYVDDIFADGDDRTIAEAFIKVIREQDESISGLKDVAKLIHDEVDMDEDEFYPRYYKIKTRANKIYWRLKKRYINTGRIEIKKAHHA